jgi:putative MATE family efflux protein
LSSDLKQSTRDLGEAPLAGLLLKLSLPAMGSMTTMALYNIINTFWVAKLGYQPIAAITVMIPFYIVSMSLASGAGVGTNALVSRRFGEKNIEAANKVCGQIFPISICCGLLFVAAAVFSPRQILTICGATPDVMDFAAIYLSIMGCGIPFTMFLIIATNLLRGSGEAVRPMIFSLTGTVLNMILDPLLIFGIGPFPEMGFPGAALASIISQFIAAAITLYYIIGHKTVYRMKIKDIIPDFTIIKDIFRVGLPSAVVEFMESVLFTIYNHVLAGFGSMALAAGGLMIRAIDFAFMPILGVMQGVLPVIGYCFGAGLWPRLWRAVKLSSICLAIFLGVATIALEIYSPQVIGLFTHDAQMNAMAVDAMRIVISSLAFVGPTMIYIAVFQGMSKAATALMLSLVRQVVFFIPVMILLPKLMGLMGVWLAWPLCDILAFSVTCSWMIREYRLRKTGSFRQQAIEMI